MERGVVDIGILEGIGAGDAIVILHTWHRLNITINIQQFWTFGKGQTSYSFHPAAYRDSSKATAKEVFASLFLSAIYILNGRKVVTWIL